MLTSLRFYGFLKTEPSEKIVFTAPFNEKKVLPFRVANAGSLPIGWRVKVNNSRRINVDPPSGVLRANETTLISIICEPFNYHVECSAGDSMTFEWNTVSGSDTRDFDMLSKSDSTFAACSKRIIRILYYA
ncbi:MSP domain protein [Trichuris suis]|nr:MSP domain protein [Trichuris suis]